ncbi:MAG: hypothetical protein IKS31_04065 [Clostridia bacterium]|nr:hypothetical protein [Clostridia bacterium]
MKHGFVCRMALLLCLLMLLPLAAAATQEAAEETVEYTTGGAVYRVWAGWTRVAEDGADCYYRESADNALAGYLAVAETDAGSNAVTEELLRLTAAEMLRQYGAKDREPVSGELAGHAGLWFSCPLAGAEGSAACFLCADGGKILCMTLIMEKIPEEDALARLTEAVATLRFSARE